MENGERKAYSEQHATSTVLEENEIFVARARSAGPSNR